MADEKDPVLSKAIEKLGASKVTFQDLLKILSPPAATLEVPENLPVPAQVTTDQTAALERLADVYGSVVPTERRDLEPAEVTALLEERATIVTIEKMMGERKEAIRTTALNANDVRFEASLAEEPVEGWEVPERDKDGHYIVKGSLEGEPGTPKRLSVETRKGSTTINPEELKALAEDPDVEWFSHKDFLSMTRQVRVFDEEAAMILLRKRPGLLRAIREATHTGNGSVSVQER